MVRPVPSSPNNHPSGLTCLLGPPDYSFEVVSGPFSTTLELVPSQLSCPRPLPKFCEDPLLSLLSNQHPFPRSGLPIVTPEDDDPSITINGLP